VTIQAQRVPGSPIPAKLDSVTLRTSGSTPEEKALVHAAVERRARNADDAALLLDALFGPYGRMRHRGDNKADRDVYAARHAWLERCRAWHAGRGQPLAGTWVPRDMQRAYERATGDVWTPPAEDAA